MEAGVGAPARPSPALLVYLAVLALGLEGVWLAVLALGDLRHAATVDLLGLLLVATLLFLGALVAIVRAGPLAPRDEARALAAIVLAGALFRLTLVPGTPSLSDDCWRYVWEGRVLGLGHDPYALAPDDPALASARDALWARVNHRDVPAVYGPLIELAFAGLARLPGELAPFRAAFVGCDVVVGLLLVRALRRAGRSPLLALAWAWHPLVVLELAGQAHLEVAPIALLLLALDLAATGRLRLAALALGGAVATKYLPLLVAPALLARAPTWRARAGLAALVLLPLVACGLPFAALHEARPPGAGALAFAQRWRANPLGYGVLAWGLERAGLSAALCRHVVARFVDVPPGFDPAEHTTWIETLPRLVAGALAAGVALLASRPRAERSSGRRWSLGVRCARSKGCASEPRLRTSCPSVSSASWREVDLERAALAAGAVFVALSPVVHPWYGLWLVPLLPLRARGAGPWLAVSLALPLCYTALIGYDGTEATWREPLWARVAIGAPAAAWLVLAAARGVVAPGVDGRAGSPDDRGAMRAEPA